MELEPNDLLKLWRSVMVAALRKDLPDLTWRQFTLLLQIYTSPPPHTVRGLAQELNMSKPAVTRALDRLEKLDFLRRKVDDSDRRSILVQRSVAGSVFLREFADMAGQHAGEI